jgi:hypothetical protein
VPDGDAAADRARDIVLGAFAGREVVPPARNRRRALVVALALVAVAGIVAVASPPGRAVVDRVREAVGVARAQPALFSLPARGRLLVVSDGGLWVVDADGSRRRLGDYRAGSWSPFGRFVVATSATELAALEPDGDVRWSLARPAPHGAVWTGSRTDTRIAYADRSGIRVVAGDGTGDRLVAPGASGPLAWRPGSRSQLALVAGGRARLVDVDTHRPVWQAHLASGGPVRTLEWSTDGRRLLVLQPRALRVYDERGRVVKRDDPSDGQQDVDASFRPGSREVAVIRRHGSQSTVFRLDTEKPIFAGTGTLDQVVWSPDGLLVLVAWPTADQWVFVPARSTRRLRAVANVSAQFRGRSFPVLAGWCCPS